MTTPTPVPRRDPATEPRVIWAVRLGNLLIRSLAVTWRFRTVNAAPWQALMAAKRPLILCLWHGELLPLAWRQSRHGLYVMVSEHRDGEIIAQLLHRWGCQTVRGSTSRGAGRALLGMVRLLSEGKEFAITPDGPRGPAGVAQTGVLLASQRAQAPIVTLRATVSRAWRLRSWDRFIIPKPFATITVTYGDPWVAPAADEAAVAELTRRMGPPAP